MNIESATLAVNRSLKMRKADSETEEVRPSSSVIGAADATDSVKAFSAQRVRTVALINAAAVMERMDEQAWTHCTFLNVKYQFPHLTAYSLQLTIISVRAHFNRYCRRCTMLLERPLTHPPRSWGT